jgi:hypothetical protein
MSSLHGEKRKSGCAGGYDVRAAPLRQGIRYHKLSDKSPGRTLRAVDAGTSSPYIPAVLGGHPLPPIPAEGWPSG